MMTEFITAWNEECARWIDMTVKVAINESNDNKELINQWCKKYIDIAYEAVMPLAQEILNNPEDSMNEIKASLIERLNKNGLSQ